MKAIEFELLPLNSISVSNKRILKLRYQTQTQSFDKGLGTKLILTLQVRAFWMLLKEGG